jgi:hypothetical protein
MLLRWADGYACRKKKSQRPLSVFFQRREADLERTQDGNDASDVAGDWIALGFLSFVVVVNLHSLGAM